EVRLRSVDDLVLHHENPTSDNLELNRTVGSGVYDVFGLRLNQQQDSSDNGGRTTRTDESKGHREAPIGETGADPKCQVGFHCHRESSARHKVGQCVPKQQHMLRAQSMVVVVGGPGLESRSDRGVRQARQTEWRTLREVAEECESRLTIVHV